jgi:Tfp pilus assembly protein PilX
MAGKTRQPDSHCAKQNKNAKTTWRDMSDAAKTDHDGRFLGSKAGGL